MWCGLWVSPANMRDSLPLRFFHRSSTFYPLDKPHNNLPYLETTIACDNLYQQKRWRTCPQISHACHLICVCVQGESPPPPLINIINSNITNGETKKFPLGTLLPDSRFVSSTTFYFIPCWRSTHLLSHRSVCCLACLGCILSFSSIALCTASER